MTRISPLALGALALAFVTTANGAKKDVAGYTAERAALATTLPVHIVALNTKIRPQLGFRHRPIGAETRPPPDPRWAGLEMAMGGGLLGGAIIAGSHYAWLKRQTRETFAPIQQAGCDLRVDSLLQQSVADAIRRSAWGVSVVPTMAAADDRDLDKLVASDGPRQVFAITASLTPEFDALVTSLEVAAYAPVDDQSSWKSKPAWKDLLIVVSDQVQPAAKTQADIDRMVSEELARFEASGGEALIQRVNAQSSVDALDRKKAVEAMKLHQKNMREAKTTDWSVDSLKRERATLWSADSCQRMHVAVDQAEDEIGRMLDALYTQQLPPRLGLKDADVAVHASNRHVHALPGGLFVFSVDGATVPLGFREDLLPLDD